MPESSTPRTPLLIALITILCLSVIGLGRIQLLDARGSLIEWLYSTVIVLAAVGLWIGILNVLWIHTRRIQAGQAEWHMSLWLILALLVTLTAGLSAGNGIHSPLVGWLFDHLILPGQLSLFALLPFFLAVAAYRYLRIDRPGGGWLLFGALIMIAVQMPMADTWLPDAITTNLNSIIEGPINAAMRGALIGSVLAIVITSVRRILRRK